MDSLFEVSTAISSAGLSVGIVNNLMNPFLMWIEIILMFLGRLEIYIVFIFIAKLFDFKDR
jgi:trk system potassium uptake protein TrkH